ncbi:MAG: hypothetical protein V3R89_05070, partial [Thermoanaerobaculia bacterium]
IRAMITDWASFKVYAVESFAAKGLPKYPTVYSICTRNHFEAAVNWYRESYKPEQVRKAQEGQRQEERHREQLAARQRVEELRARPFEELRQEKLNELVTPGSELNQWLNEALGLDSAPQEIAPEEIVLRALYERATVEAIVALEGPRRGELGRLRCKPGMVLSGRHLTPAEHDLYGAQIEPSVTSA